MFGRLVNRFLRGVSGVTLIRLQFGSQLIRTPNDSGNQLTHHSNKLGDQLMHKVSLGNKLTNTVNNAQYH